MFCPYCGKETADGAVFCGICGQKIVHTGVQSGTNSALGRPGDAQQGNAVRRMQAGAGEQNPRRQQNIQGRNAAQYNGTRQTIGGKGPGSGTGRNTKSGSGNSKKPVIAAVVIAGVLVLAAVLVVVFFAVPSKADEYQEQVDLGEQYLAQENYEQAIVELSAAIEIDDQQTDAYMARAEAYTALGENSGEEEEKEENLDAALSDYDTVIELAPEETQAYMKAADIYAVQLTEYESAEAILEEGLAANPENAELTEALEEVRELIEEAEETEQKTERYQAYYDKLTELQEQYGEAYIAEGSSGYSDYLMGLCFARLVDFDADGTEELLLAYNNSGGETAYTIEVWGFIEGEMEKLGSSEGYFEQTGRLIILAESEGKWYLVEGMVDSFDFHYLLGLEDGTMTQVKALEAYDLYETDASYFIDGAEATEAAYEEEYALWLGQCETYDLNYGLDDYEALAELENTLETLQSYLESVSAESAEGDTADGAAGDSTSGSNATDDSGSGSDAAGESGSSGDAADDAAGESGSGSDADTGADDDALLTDAQLDEIREALGVPDDPGVEYTLSEPWYWDAAEIWLIDVSISIDGKYAASASVDLDGGIQRSISPYSG